LSTYQQQVCYLAKQNNIASPKNFFLTDLAQAILHWWQAKGDTVIMMANLNKDV